MRIATYHHRGRRQVGALSDDGTRITPFALTPAEAERGALPLIERAAADGKLPLPTGAPVALAEVQLEAPLPRPRRSLFCVGRNYHAHAKELRETVFKNNSANTTAWPIVFSKLAECVIGPDDAVRMPGAVSTQIDYEAEITIVIGQGGRNIPRADAMRHVFGYTIINDVTARDVQMRHQQWDLGKSFDTFCPMGPWIVTADALDATDTRVRCWVTPEGGVADLRQDARTTDLIFDIPTLVETCSRGITLLPGDLIATGSPAGVGMGFDPPRWLRHGDTVHIEVDGLGVLSNRFVQE